MGTWPNLIQILVGNVANQTSTEMVKEATLECIGYICQDIVSCRTNYACLSQSKKD